MKTHFHFFLLFLILNLSLSACKKDPVDLHEPETEEKGSVVVDKIISPGLQDNLLNDDPERKISIYLPHGYDTENSKSYPVLYLLHAFGCDNDTWFGGIFSDLYGPEDKPGLFMKKILDTLIQKEYIKPMIIVCPSSINSYDGSWYTNSIVTGQWEDFIVQDVVAYVDANYRTLPTADSRGIAGHSMGAYGSMKLAMKHPDVFCSVYSMSGSAVSIGTVMETRKDYILQAMQLKRYDRFESEPWLRIPIAMVVAMAPNPSIRPFMGEFPYDQQGNPLDSIWQKWLKQDPVSMLDEYDNNMKQLKAIRFDCGTSDDALLSNSIFSEALTSKGIEHMFEPYSGDHNNKIPERIAEELLPYFSYILVHEDD